ncbi:hypothetical protein [Rubrivivax gelatinosus]|uniref:hypothetical protein n=1 Tax=Rubrivivax gelatinosus TaxID=28068 RepID=UPI0009DA80D8|nr:hypothetical protein [Rubrivivax gelatinosus]MBG6078986.1 hypothetical protein [Rubrivivax gelatinosus]
MNFIANNIVWWQISLEALINSWIPGIATFLLGIWLSRIDEHRKLRRKLRDQLLEIFIPVFNSGQAISLAEAEDAAKRLRYTLNAYKRIYPGVLSAEAESGLNSIFADGFMVNRKINPAFMEPNRIQDLIKAL